LIVDNLDPKHLVTTGQGLSSRKAEDLAGRSPDYQLLMVFIPISRHNSLHRHCLLSAQKRRSSPPRSYIGTVRGPTPEPEEPASPGTLLRPFLGSRLRSDGWGRPGIADGMEVASWSREQHPPYSPPIIPPSPPGIWPSNENMGPVKCSLGLPAFHSSSPHFVTKVFVRSKSAW